MWRPTTFPRRHFLTASQPVRGLRDPPSRLPLTLGANEDHDHHIRRLSALLLATKDPWMTAAVRGTKESPPTFAVTCNPRFSLSDNLSTFSCPSSKLSSRSLLHLPPPLQAVTNFTSASAPACWSFYLGTEMLFLQLGSFPDLSKISLWEISWTFQDRVFARPFSQFKITRMQDRSDTPFGDSFCNYRIRSFDNSSHDPASRTHACLHSCSSYLPAT